MIAEKPDVSMARPRVLVVHESRIMRASITRYLKNEYDCIEAVDFDAGWAMLCDEPGIEVVLADIGLPREEGLPFIARVASCDSVRIAATPVIAIVSEDGHTGNAVEEARQRAIKAGAVDFIAKTATAVETLARIQSASRLHALRKAVQDKDVALSLTAPVDPVAGLMTIEYLHVAGQQWFAHALRSHTELAVLAVEIDGLKDIDQRIGVNLSGTISRELSGVLARALRREDIVVAAGSGRYLALVPGLSISDVADQVARLQARLAAVVMRYRGEIIQITVSVGASSLLADAPRDVFQLMEIATRRREEAASAAPGQFFGATPPPEPEPEVASAPVLDESSVDTALGLLSVKGEGLSRRHMARLALKLIPLLRLMEREFQTNFRLSRLKERAGSLQREVIEK